MLLDRVSNLVNASLIRGGEGLSSRFYYLAIVLGKELYACRHIWLPERKARGEAMTGQCR